MLIDILIAEQERTKASDTRMAADLDMTEVGWRRIRQGGRGLGRRTLGAVLRRYPALAQEVLFYLESGGTILPDDGKDVPAVNAEREGAAV